MNGQAITKRYEVTDADTGEAVTGAYVLVPKEDDLATTVLFGYAALCGFDESQSRAVAMNVDPQNGADREILDAFAEQAGLPKDPDDLSSESVDGPTFLHQATIGDGADGSVEHAYDLWRYLGFEPVHVMMRSVSAEESEAADERMKQRAARTCGLLPAIGTKTPNGTIVGYIPNGRGGTVAVLGDKPPMPHEAPDLRVK